MPSFRTPFALVSLGAMLAIASAPAVAQTFRPVALPPALEISRSMEPVPLHRVASPAAPTEQYSHGDPSSAAQYLLEFINRARANPPEEGIRLATTNDADVRMAYEYFGVDTASLRTEFAAYAPKPPLAFHPMLLAAAEGHAADMRQNNFQGHTGSDGSTFDQRVNRAGYTGWSRLAENVSGYSRSIWFAHAGFNVDWGVPDLGHRKAIMDTEEDKTDFAEIGIGIEDVGVQPPQGQVGRYVVAEVFGVRSGVRYIVGVVYSDANTNGFYDPGEGIPGVTIMPDAGQYFAVSSSSGGYAIPVTSVAVLNITFSGGPFGTGVTRQAVVGAESVKLDAVAGRDLGAPTLVAPADGATVGSGAVEFRWNDPPGTFTHFGLEIAANATMTDPLIDTTVQTNTLTMSLPDTSRFYWRVRAGNGATWGPYSEMRSFSRAPSGISDARRSFIGELNVVPNPVYGRAHVVVELPSSGVVRSTIYDAIGRPAKTLPHRLMSAGRNAATFDADELPSGAYILECWTISGVLRAPFVIAR